MIDTAPTVQPSGDAPDPAWVRGVCPRCSAPVISDTRYIGGRGYVILWLCWESQGAEPRCTYRKIL
jgi:hypothetical protein